MRELTDDEQDAYAEHFYNGEPLPGDDPLCEWCSAVVPDGESDYPPYCSSDCEQASGSETYASVHPRPEEVG